MRLAYIDNGPVISICGTQSKATIGLSEPLYHQVHKEQVARRREKTVSCSLGSINVVPIGESDSFLIQTLSALQGPASALLGVSSKHGTVEFTPAITTSLLYYQLHRIYLRQLLCSWRSYFVFISCPGTQLPGSPSCKRRQKPPCLRGDSEY